MHTPNIITVDTISKRSLPQAVTFQRGEYGELGGVLFDTTASAVLDKLDKCLPASFVSFDKKGRGDALNVDLYGWDPDEEVGVVQVRQAFRRYRDGFLNIRKTYVLCGYNEIGTAFRHPVSAHAVRGAVNAGADPVQTVRASQRWMWGVTSKQLEAVRRQGDILIVPERGTPRGELTEQGTEARLAGTHIVRSERIVTTTNGRLYALRPTLIHTKNQHRDARAPMADNSWYSVRVAHEAEAWDFSARFGD